MYMILHLVVNSSRTELALEVTSIYTKLDRI